MLTVQHRLPLPRALPTQARRNRKPFQPGTVSQPYRLPREVQNRLEASLLPFRNKQAALALAQFLGRFWSMPGRVALPFPIDRRALADREDLGLSEAQIRGGIRVLELVGFLARWQTSGSRYKPTPDGLHRKPIPFVFGSDYAPLFIAANRRAGVARGRQEGARRYQAPDTSGGPSVGFLEDRSKRGGAALFAPVLDDGTATQSQPNSPKRRSEANPVVLMGEVAKGCRERQGVPQTPELDSGLESALERLRVAFEASRAVS